MIDHADNYCKIITNGDDARKIARSALNGVNIDPSDSDHLLNERFLEVRKFSSEKPGMGHCVVVKCSKGVFWNIPNKILERVDKK